MKPEIDFKREMGQELDEYLEQDYLDKTREQRQARAEEVMYSKEEERLQRIDQINRYRIII
jgi:hypothetical protein